jgi:hypothetical protein
MSLKRNQIEQAIAAYSFARRYGAAIARVLREARSEAGKDHRRSRCNVNTLLYAVEAGENSSDGVRTAPRRLRAEQKLSNACASM